MEAVDPRTQKAGQRKTDVINRQEIMDFSSEFGLSANIIENITL
jgi:hypothetical protein